jgi:hypothetical protein
MAKATVITPTMLINTGRAPSGQGNGQCVRVDLYFDSTTPKIDVSMTSILQDGCFNTVQCLYIDNSLNAASVIITLPGIQQRIIVNGFSQSLEPVYMSDSAATGLLIAECSTANIAGFPVRLWFSNVPQPFYSKEGLLNNVRNIKYTLPMGNSDANHAYSWGLTLTNTMQQYNVPDWQTFFIDNSAGFQHFVVTDASVGATVAIINPYTIAQFSSLRVGSVSYTFAAYDLANNAAQNNFIYGYDVNILLRSFPGDTYFNTVGFNGQYTASTQQVLAIGGTFQLYPNYMRKRVTFYGPTAFSARFNGFTQNSAADPSGSHVINYDFQSVSAIQGSFVAGQSIAVTTVAAQTIQVRDKF